MPCSISPWAISARSMPSSNQTGRATRPLRAWSSAMSARRKQVGDADLARPAPTAMPTKAPTWIQLAVDLERPGHALQASASASSLGAAALPSRGDASAIANSSPLRRATTGSVGRAARSALRRSSAASRRHVIAVAVVDRLEAMELERDDDAACRSRSAAVCAKLLAAVGEALAVEQAGHAVGRRDQRRARARPRSRAPLRAAGRRSGASRTGSARRSGSGRSPAIWSSGPKSLRRRSAAAGRTCCRSRSAANTAAIRMPRTSTSRRALTTAIRQPRRGPA